jgi:lysosomal Pro-X carboxypeptidase
MYMAMTNYPYEADFLEPMPAWPVQEACKEFEDIKPKIIENKT